MKKTLLNFLVGAGLAFGALNQVKAKCKEYIMIKMIFRKKKYAGQKKDLRD